MNQYEKGVAIMDFLQGLGIDMITIGQAIDDKNLEKSFQLIQSNPDITKDEFLTKMGIKEEV